MNSNKQEREKEI